MFREFLKSEYSEENMLFWLAIEEYRQIEDAKVREERARIIYEDYISILSPKEVFFVVFRKCQCLRIYVLMSIFINFIFINHFLIILIAKHWLALSKIIQPLSNEKN